MYDERPLTPDDLAWLHDRQRDIEERRARGARRVSLHTQIVTNPAFMSAAALESGAVEEEVLVERIEPGVLLHDPSGVLAPRAKGNEVEG